MSQGQRVREEMERANPVKPCAQACLHTGTMERLLVRAARARLVLACLVLATL